MEVIEGFGVSDLGFQEVSSTNTTAGTELRTTMYEQRNIDHLKHMLLLTTMELEAVRDKSEEEIRKKEENTKQLLYLLQLTSKQRDEARDQLRRLLSKPFPIDSYPLTSTYQSESQPFITILGNPGITTDFESYNSSSSPMISFPKPVSSFDHSSINFTDSGGISQLMSHVISSNQSCNNLPVPLVSFGPGGLVQFDKADLVIEHLVSNKPLPEKGKLLQAVMEPGPLLKILLMAGPLPRWRNPPPLQTIKGGGCGGRIINSKTIGRVNFDSLNSSSTMNFAGPSEWLFCQRKRPPLLSSSCVGRYQNNAGKRQKSH